MISLRQSYNHVAPDDVLAMTAQDIGGGMGRYASKEAEPAPVLASTLEHNGGVS